MRPQAEIDGILNDVRSILKRSNQSSGLGLDVPPDGYDDHDGWLSILVLPDRDGVRAGEYVDALSDAESELRAAGASQVILVPAFTG